MSVASNQLNIKPNVTTLGQHVILGDTRRIRLAVHYNAWAMLSKQGFEKTIKYFGGNPLIRKEHGILIWYERLAQDMGVLK